MIGAIIPWLIAKGVPAKAAKPLLIAIAFVAILGLLGTAKCAYDRSVIAQHDAKREAATAKADRKADQKAAEQRMDDIARSNTEAQEIKEAVNEAGSDPIARRRAYYECVRLQQAARNQHKPPAEC